MTEAAASVSSRGGPPPLSAPALHTLLRNVVDYAGLFPPASLSMSAAVAEFVGHRDAPEAWALGRFVLPAARLEEFDEAARDVLPRGGGGSRSWALSALLGSDVEQDVQRIERFNDRHGDARSGAVLVDTAELKAHTPRDIARASELLDRRFDTYMEIPVAEDPVELVNAIAGTTAKAKIRTGGVTADAFPSSAHIVRFMRRCLDRNVAFKATAGLHHPWRGEYRLTSAPDAPRGVMFGFLNVLLCVASLREGFDESSAISLLEERDPDAICLSSSEVRWRERIIPIAALMRARASMASFGSCSFREPMEELRALSLL